MRFKIYIYTILLFFCCINIQAQDFAFSQYYMNKLYLNPAYVASEIGGRFNVQHRQQWPGISPGYTFQITQLSASTTFGYCDSKSKSPISYGIGVTGNFATEGEVALNTLQGALVGGIIISGLEKSMFRFASFGGKIRYNNVYLDNNGWIFSDQIDPVHGPDATLPTVALLPSDLTTTYMDSGFGGIVSFGDTERHFNIGFAIDNWQSKDNLLNSENPSVRPTKQILHGYAYLPLLNNLLSKDKHKLLINGKFEKQSVLHTLSLGAYWIYRPKGAIVEKQKYTNLFAGFQYRNRDWVDFKTHTNAFVAVIGARKKTSSAIHQFSFSYDVQTSGLTGSQGVFELGYTFSSEYGLFGCGGKGKSGGSKRKSKGPSVSCPI
ncbi:MAG: PorP/SprF family type IX secretion system membrane protein [Chitinophagales bacterium]